MCDCEKANTCFDDSPIPYAKQVAPEALKKVREDIAKVLKNQGECVSYLKGLTGKELRELEHELTVKGYCIKKENEQSSPYHNWKICVAK